MAIAYRPDRGDGLTNKQRRFVEEYLVDLNAAAAARRAGYSESSASIIGRKNLGLPQVQAALTAEMDALTLRTHISQDKVMRELARIAFADPRRVMSWGPDGVTLIDSSTLDADDAAMVAEVSQTTSANGGSLRIKLHSKIQSLELIGRRLGLFPTRTEITGADGGPLQVAAVDMTDEQLLALARTAVEDEESDAGIADPDPDLPPEDEEIDDV